MQLYITSPPSIPVLLKFLSFFISFFIDATHNRSVTQQLHNSPLQQVSAFLRAAVRLRMNREPIPELVVPGFEPGTAAMVSKRVIIELTGPQSL